MAQAVKEYNGAVDRGLEGVVACTTAISSILGNTLTYRGYKIEDLAENICFEECIYLLWEGNLPKEAELKSFKQELDKDVKLTNNFKKALEFLYGQYGENSHPMDFLKAAVAMQSVEDKDALLDDLEANKRKAMRLTAKTGSIVAAFQRLRKGKEILDPKSGKSFAWNMLYMMNGVEPTEEREKIFDTCLVLHADHELNCSAFATRVTASSLSDINSSIVSAIGTLKGPLHGGANTAVMEMLSEISNADEAKEFVKTAMKEKKKVMGIGHRVYKNGDPRAQILKKYSKELCAETNQSELYEISEVIDEAMVNEKGLKPNVDFYSATVYHCLGIPGDLFTPIFTASRVSGWCAHFFEQLENNRIYRPRGQYIGEDIRTVER